MLILARISVYLDHTKFQGLTSTLLEDRAVNMSV
jgi:hypothetical protein